jgi:hypothetical protein
MSRNRGSRRQYAMTPQTPAPPVGQEAAVAALQATTQHLNERVGELTKATNDGLQAITHKLDEISRQSAEIAAIAAAQREHGTGLERAFGQIAASNLRIDQLAEKQHNTEKVAATGRGGLIVLSAIGAILFSVIAWAVNPVLQTAGENAKEIMELKLDLEKIRKQP